VARRWSNARHAPPRELSAGNDIALLLADEHLLLVKERTQRGGALRGARVGVGEGAGAGRGGGASLQVRKACGIKRVPCGQVCGSSGLRLSLSN
jgi:hypothetical protein